MTVRRFDEVCSIVMGQAPVGDSYNHRGEGLPLIAGAGDFGEDYPEPKKFTTSPSKVCQSGDIILGIRATIGVKVVANAAACLGRGVAGLRPKPGLDGRFLWHWLTHAGPVLASKAKGATFKQVNKDDIGSLRIAVPALDEQKRIGEVLDHVAALRAKRRATLAQCDALTQSIFLDMFGDPSTNPKGWAVAELGSLAIRFSDGPFGSNLKSEHYTEEGVRVVRLQNIAAGRFLDSDRAFISRVHFERLRKHECVPGDILVATLGDPNLRACLQPDFVSIALNKADCVQIRVDERVADRHWLCALLNQPSTLGLAQSLMHGQTRVRISMGRLRRLVVPVPPVRLQRVFARRLEAQTQLMHGQERSRQALDDLFASLQHRAFDGTLFADPKIAIGLRSR